MIFSTYGLCVLVALGAGFLMMTWLHGREGASRKVMGLFAPMALVFGFVGARLFAGVFALLGAAQPGPLFSLEPTLYAMGGAILGVTGACFLAAKKAGVPFGDLADSLAPAGMLSIALARCGEVFAEFGAAPVIENGPTLFPLAVQHADGSWHMTVFFLEAIFAFAAMVYAMNMRTEKPGERFALTLAFYGMTQVLCESFREHTLAWGFIGVQQLFYIAAALGLLGYYANVLAHKPYHNKKEPIGLLGWITAIECAAAVLLMEYAIDHWVLPAALDYVILAMAACGVFLSVRLVARKATRNEEIPWKEK